TSWCKQGVNLEWDASPRDVVLHSDADKIEIIVRNLIHNALKYTDQGEVRVGAAVTPDESSVEFVITDTGQGITEDDLERIFEMLQQSGGGPPRQGGVGLGLFLVKRLTTALGGSIRVESQLGRGSRFGVTLPLATVAASATAPSSPTETRHAPGRLLTTTKV